jgi:hypothetical protein
MHAFFIYRHHHRVNMAVQSLLGPFVCRENNAFDSSLKGMEVTKVSVEDGRKGMEVNC